MICECMGGLWYPLRYCSRSELKTAPRNGCLVESGERRPCLLLLTPRRVVVRAIPKEMTRRLGLVCLLKIEEEEEGIEMHWWLRCGF
jgi:hypothetical protein